jgi:beta-glucanase (GH16 family)
MKKQLSMMMLTLLVCGGCSKSEQSAEYLSTPKNAEVTAYDGYHLIWNDEFNEDGKPSSDWVYEKGFVRNNELQWYQEENASVSNGSLLIEGRKEQLKNPNYEADSKDWRKNREFAEYTSTCVTTRKSFQFMYGRVEVRAKIPVASGSWPAIWLLGNQWGWPENGEIDMMEYYIRDGKPSILANAAWGGDRPSHAVWDGATIPFTHFTEKDSDWANKYHIWRMDWDKEFIRLYLDDELLNEIELSKTFNGGWKGNTENPFNTSAEGFGDYILLNLAIGSNGGTPDDSQFPLRYYVDYVRVYQQNE